MCAVSQVQAHGIVVVRNIIQLSSVGVSSYVYFVVGMCVVSQVQALGAAALGNIIKSLARAQYNDDTLFRSLAAAVVRLPSSAFDAQVC